MAEQSTVEYTIKEAAEESGYSELYIAGLQRVGKIKRRVDEATGRIYIPAEEVLMLTKKAAAKEARKREQVDAGRKYPYKKPSTMAYDMVTRYIKGTKMDSRVKKRLLEVMEGFKEAYKA